MIDHVGFAVTNLDASKAFYEAALAPLGLEILMTVTPEQTEAGGSAIGFGSNGKPFFWIGDNERVGEGTHIAFAADSRDQVDAFYNGGMAAGGRDNGPPGIRAHYHPDYYGAFMLDPDGMNIEAVCRKPA